MRRLIQHRAHSIGLVLTLIPFILLASATACRAQQAGPAVGDASQNSQKDQKGAKKAEQQDADQSAQPDAKKPYKPAPNPQAIVGVGYADWGLDGSEHKFRQYATPPEGFFLSRLMLAPRLGKATSGMLDLKGLGEDDYRLDGRFSAFYGNTKASGILMRNRFFDPNPAFISPSDRYIQEAFLKQTIFRGFSLSARYKMDEQNDFWGPPRLPNHSRIRSSLATAEGKLGPGFLSLGFMDWTFFDRTGIYPDRSVGRWLASYLWNVTPFLGLEGSYTRHNISEAGLPKSHVESVSISGDALVGSSSTVSVEAKRDKIDAPVVQNGYVKERRTAGGSFSHRWNNWLLQAGFRRRETDRVNGDHTFLDVPKWSIFDGRLAGKIGDNARLTIRGSTESLDDAPHMITADSRSLYWSSRSNAQVRFETFDDNSTAYLMAAWRRMDNDPRHVNVTLKSFVAGATCQPTSRLNAFIEYTLEIWQGHTTDPGLPQLSNFMPTSSTTVLGTNWIIDKRTTAWLNFTHYTTKNDNPLLLRDGNTYGDFFSFSVRHSFPSGQEIGILVAPWTYRDKVVGFTDYSTTAVVVTASGRF